MTPSLPPLAIMLNMVAALLVIPIVAGFFLRMPKLVVAGFIGLLFCFSDSSWGALDNQGTIYGRGSGMFYFSLLNLLLFVCGFTALMKRLAVRSAPPLPPPMGKYLAAFIVLLLGHLFAGLMANQEIMDVLSYRGAINVLNMMVFMYLVIMSFQDEQDMNQLLYLFIALGLLRSLWGLFRYAVMGGDTSNPYQNLEGLDMKLVYFDINDSFVASLSAFCCAWLLTAKEFRLQFLTRVFLVGVLLLEIATVALSFRRSSLIGLGLMFIFLFLRLPGQRKLLFAVIAATLLSVSASIFFQQRLQFNSSGGILEAMIYDIAPRTGNIKDSRLYELYAAAQSMEGYWLLGRGAWGSFTGDKDLLSYHGEDFSFIHSGFGHVILKTGLVGLLIFCGILFSFLSSYFKRRRYLIGTPRLMADAGFASFLFWMPTLLVGTPIIEIRTMLMLGLTLALPYVAVGMQAAQQHHPISPAAYAAA